MDHSCSNCRNKENSFIVSPSENGYQTYWLISDYLHHLKNEASFDSPAFGEASGDLQFYIRVYGKTNDANDMDCFSLRCRSKSRRPILVSWILFLKARNGDKIKLVDEEFLTETQTGDQVVGSYGMALRSDLVQRCLDLNGGLTLGCYVRPRDLGERPDAPSPRPDHTGSMLDLLAGGEFADLTLAVRGDTVVVHKCILTAHSTFFARLLNRDDFPVNAQVELPEKKNLVREMLFYMYTGKSPNAWELAWELIPISVKYGIQGLTNICENVILHRLSPETAGDTLSLATEYNLEDLRSQTVEFVKKKYSEVKISRGWKKAVYLAPESVAQVMKYLSLISNS